MESQVLELYASLLELNVSACHLHPSQEPNTNDMEGFLECRVSLPSYQLLRPSNKRSALKIEHKSHAIVWVLVKSNQHDPESKSGKPMLESKVFFTTLEYCGIRKSPTELFLPCIQQLEDEWNMNCEAAEDHLSNMVCESTTSLASLAEDLLA